jgi:hypothetical protein
VGASLRRCVAGSAEAAPDAVSEVIAAAAAADAAAAGEKRARVDDAVGAAAAPQHAASSPKRARASRDAAGVGGRRRASPPPEAAAAEAGGAASAPSTPTMSDLELDAISKVRCWPPGAWRKALDVLASMLLCVVRILVCNCFPGVPPKACVRQRDDGDLWMHCGGWSGRPPGSVFPCA